jgi:hypothetical protein
MEQTTHSAACCQSHSASYTAHWHRYITACCLCCSLLAVPLSTSMEKYSRILYVALIYTMCCSTLPAQSLPANNPPAHSCRAGLAQLLSRTGAQGRLEAVPVHMQLRKRAGIDDAYHVINFTESTMDEVSEWVSHQHQAGSLAQACSC